MNIELKFGMAQPIYAIDLDDSSVVHIFKGTAGDVSVKKQGIWYAINFNSRPYTVWIKDEFIFSTLPEALAVVSFADVS